MHTSPRVSIIIPSRNEPYLQKTVQDILQKATGDIEVIAVLDGYWPKPEEIVDDVRVIYLHHGEAKGMRAAINHGVAVSRSEYILKCDAHVMFAEGFDAVLRLDCADDWVVVPRRYALDPVRWEIEKRTDAKYPIDYMYLSTELHGEPWPERRDDPQYKDRPIDDLMSAQGSCWFMKRSYYHELELLDEDTYGKFYSEFQEIGLKCWLSGGSVKVNKKTWYAHWHKTEGRGYSLDKNEQEKATQAVLEYRLQHAEAFNAFIERFKPVPTWI